VLWLALCLVVDSLCVLVSSRGLLGEQSGCVGGQSLSVGEGFGLLVLVGVVVVCGSVVLRSTFVGACEGGWGVFWCVGAWCISSLRFM
jgi:hypothetical protein